MGHDRERETLRAGIQRYFDEHEQGALVTKWYLVCEVRDADQPRPRLAYRTGDLNGEGMSSWDSLGFLHSAITAIEDQSRANIIESGDDDEDDDAPG